MALEIGGMIALVNRRDTDEYEAALRNVEEAQRQSQPCIKVPTHIWQGNSVLSVMRRHICPEKEFEKRKR